MAEFKCKKMSSAVRVEQLFIQNTGSSHSTVVPESKRVMKDDFHHRLIICNLLKSRSMNKPESSSQ